MSEPLRILVVEDSQDDTLLLLHQLRRGGYEPTFERVDTPEAMSAALDRQNWDLVVADFSMPRFNALAALELLKKKGLDLPFIIVSGTIGEELAVAAMRNGAQDYIMKGNLARLVPSSGLTRSPAPPIPPKPPGAITSIICLWPTAAWGSSSPMLPDMELAPPC